MIQHLEINNFKFHKSTSLKLRNLTVFCGSNSVGKSSAIQPLLLLREAYVNKSDFAYLDLLPNPVKIGTSADAIYQYSDDNEISFRLKSDKNENLFIFELEKNDYTKTLINAKKGIVEKLLIDDSEGLFNENFQYISSARLGPQAYYKRDDVVVDKYRQISVDEGKAEYCVHYLHKNQSKKVLLALINENSPLDNLINQVTAWQKEISDGINVLIQDIGKLGFELRYQYEIEAGSSKTNEYTTQNVGFGVTYVLPILVAILSAQPGSLIIIENPEAHLHPHGISKLSHLICLAAEAGIQIIIETHSDHIINGILVQSKLFENSEGKRGISKDHISIYQFERNEKEFCSEAINIDVKDDGRITYAPKGFFDQLTLDRKYLMGF
ncbi:MAG TPA: DUF3696 domain-containing protein [Flavobacterium sp.]|jgi:predicted ATPase